MGKYDGQKLEAMGLLAAGKHVRDVVRELTIPYSTVRRWSLEVQDLETSADLEVLIDAPKEVVHKLADKVQEEFELLIKDADVLVGEVVKKVDGMQLLSEDLTSASSILIKKLQAAAMTCTDARDIGYLVDAVAKLQVAFFSKGTNVQVNVGQTSSTEMSKFKSLQRPA